MNPSNQPDPKQTQVNYPGNAAAHQRDIEGAQQNEPKKPLCPNAWAIPPSPRMLKHGNDYHTCSKCGEPCDVIDLKPDTQADLIDFVTDPETIAKAVEGSMDKRMAVQAEVGLRELVYATLAKAYYNGRTDTIAHGPGGVLEGSGNQHAVTTVNFQVDDLMALFQADKAAAVVDSRKELVLHFRKIAKHQNDRGYGCHRIIGETNILAKNKWRITNEPM